MNVYFRQIYIEVGVKFPFNHLFQLYLAKEVTALVKPSEKFVKKYGSDFDLIFNVSAKESLSDNEIKGPGIYRKSKRVEFSVFLPYSVIILQTDIKMSALQFLFKGICAVFEKLEIDPSKVIEKQGALIEHICAEPAMTAQPQTPFG